MPLADLRDLIHHALLTQRNVEEAARAAGISIATLMRCQKEPEFEAAYRHARRAVFRQSVARLQQASGAAVSTLPHRLPRAPEPRILSWTIQPRQSRSTTSRPGSRNWSEQRKRKERDCQDDANPRQAGRAT